MARLRRPCYHVLRMYARRSIRFISLVNKAPPMRKIIWSISSASGRLERQWDITQSLLDSSAGRGKGRGKGWAE